MQEKVKVWALDFAVPTRLIAWQQRYTLTWPTTSTTSATSRTPIPRRFLPSDDHFLGEPFYTSVQIVDAASHAVSRLDPLHIPPTHQCDRSSKRGAVPCEK